jgi:hypothetical protein
MFNQFTLIVNNQKLFFPKNNIFAKHKLNSLIKSGNKFQVIFTNYVCVTI